MGTDSDLTARQADQLLRSLVVFADPECLLCGLCLLLLEFLTCLGKRFHEVCGLALLGFFLFLLA